jgi:Ni/Co efflux regulator RcnB
MFHRIVVFAIAAMLTLALALSQPGISDAHKNSNKGHTHRHSHGNSTHKHHHHAGHHAGDHRHSKVVKTKRAGNINCSQTAFGLAVGPQSHAYAENEDQICLRVGNVG